MRLALPETEKQRPASICHLVAKSETKTNMASGGRYLQPYYHRAVEYIQRTLNYGECCGSKLYR